MRILAAVAAAILTTAVTAIIALALFAMGGPAGLLAQDLPDSGSPLLNVDYRADVDCLLQFRAGDTAWRLDDADGWPPPDGFPSQRQFSTWTVPGIVRFTSPDRALFRARTDASEWPVRRLADDEPLANAMCI